MADRVDLNDAVASCLRELPTFSARFKEPGVLEKTQMGALAKDWEEYYFGTFAQFDQALRSHVSIGRQPHPYVQLSIDHHNIHRLVEVLRSELGDRRLGEGRIPERLVDLVSCLDQLGRRLVDVARGAATESDSSSVEEAAPLLHHQRG